MLINTTEAETESEESSDLVSVNQYDGGRNKSLTFVQNVGRPKCFPLKISRKEIGNELVIGASDSDQSVHTCSHAMK